MWAFEHLSGQDRKLLPPRIYDRPSDAEYRCADFRRQVVNHAIATDYFVPRKLFTNKHKVFHHRPRNQNVSSYFVPSAAQSDAEAMDASSRYSHSIHKLFAELKCPVPV
jgi:hypothetical protein